MEKPLKSGKRYRIRMGIQSITMKCILSGTQNAVLQTEDDERRTISIFQEGGEVISDSKGISFGARVQVVELKNL